MPSTPPKVSGSPESEAHRRWVEEQIRELQGAASSADTRIRAVDSASALLGSLTANAAVNAEAAVNRTNYPATTNRLPHPLTDPWWTDAIAGRVPMFANEAVQRASGRGSMSASARNVIHLGGALFQMLPSADESAWLDVTDWFAIPESREVVVSYYGIWGAVSVVFTEFISFNQPEVQQRKTAPLAGSEYRGLLTFTPDPSATYYRVSLEAAAGEIGGSVAGLEVFETIGTPRVGISPEGVKVIGDDGPTMEINPSLPLLSAPTTPILSSGAASVSIEWDGLGVDPETFVPARLSYVYAEEASSASGPWSRVGQTLNKSGIIVARPPVGSDRWYRLTAVDTSNRASAPSASATITVKGVDVPDLSGEVGDIIDTVDGLNKIFYQTSDTIPEAHAQGDLWFIVDSTDLSTVVGVNIWDGAQWNPYKLVADSLFVPGSVGTVSIADGAIKAPQIDASAITADKLSVGALDGQTIRGAYIEGPFIASSDAVGAGVNVLSDPGFTGAIDAGWVGSGYLGTDPVPTQLDTITWDQVVAKSNGKRVRYYGNILAGMSFQTLPRRTNTILHNHLSAIMDMTDRTLVDQVTFSAASTAWGDNQYSYALAQTDMAPAAASSSRTSYLTNSASIPITNGQSWQISLDFRAMHSGAKYASVFMQLVNASTSAVLWSRQITEAELESGGKVVATYEASSSATVKFRIAATYEGAGGGITRVARTGSWRGADLVDPDPSDNGYSRIMDDHRITPFSGADSRGNPVIYLPDDPRAQKAQTDLFLFSASMGTRSPARGFTLTADRGLELYSASGARTGALNGDSNFLTGTFATSESGERVQLDNSRIAWFGPTGILTNEVTNSDAAWLRSQVYADMPGAYPGDWDLATKSGKYIATSNAANSPSTGATVELYVDVWARDPDDSSVVFQAAKTAPSPGWGSTPYGGREWRRRKIAGVWGDWAEVGPNDTGVVDLSPYLLSVNGTLEGRRVGDSVEIYGINSSGSFASGSSATNLTSALPEQFRPSGTRSRWGTAYWQGYTGAVLARADGTMAIAQRSGSTWGSSTQWGITFFGA